MPSISSRLARVQAAWVKRAPSSHEAALSEANQIVEFLVAVDLIHVEEGEERPTEPTELRDHVIGLWRKHAGDLSVPNDGSAERRILTICQWHQAENRGTAVSVGALLVERLKVAAEGA